MGQGQGNRDLIPNAVAEIIRWQTPLAYMRRTALEDVEMHGKTIKKGDKVAMWYVSGNRDERKFENPDVWTLSARMLVTIFLLALAFTVALVTGWQSSSYRSSGMRCSSASPAWRSSVAQPKHLEFREGLHQDECHRSRLSF